MPQPTPYTPAYSFTDFAAANPTTPLPGVRVDAELDALELTLKDVRRNLALIQRDDGKLANKSVHPDALADSTLLLLDTGGFRVVGAWFAGRILSPGDIVSLSGIMYLAITSHVASSLAADIAAGRLSNAIFNSSAISATYSVKDFGVTGNGVTDETALIQTALNTLSFGGMLYFPPGVYVYSNLSLPSGVSISGASRYSAVLMCSSATGAISCGSAGGDNTLSDIKFSSLVARTIGKEFISVQTNNVTVTKCTFENYTMAARVGTVGGVLAVNFIMDKCAFRNPAIGAGTGAVSLDNYASATIMNIGAAGPTLPAQQPDFFLCQRNGDTCLLSNINATLHGIAWYVNTPAGQNIYATQVVNCLFDSAGTISGGTSAQSGCITPTGNMQETLVTNSWFGLSQGSHGLYLEGLSGTGTVDGFSVSNCQFVKNSGSGFIANGTRVKNWSVTSSKASGNAIGIRAAGATTRFSIKDNICGNIGGRGVNVTGIQVDNATAADYYFIRDNLVAGNTTPIFDGGTGVNKSVGNNF